VDEAARIAQKGTHDAHEALSTPTTQDATTRTGALGDTSLSAPALVKTALSAADHRALLAILLGVVLGSLDLAIVNTALPGMAQQLGATPAASIWVLNAYQLAVVAALLPLAALGDQWGSRRVFLLGLGVYIAGSLGCTLATSLSQLVAARAIQGLGSAGVMSVNMALVRLIYPPAQLGRGVGLNAMVVGVGTSAGPTVASLILAVAPWPWLFALNLPLGALAMVLGMRYIPHGAEHKADQKTGHEAGHKTDHKTNHQVDGLTAGLTALSFASLIFALSSAAQRADAVRVGVALAIAALSIALLLRRQRGHPAPMLPVDLFQRPLFALSALTSACSFTVQGLAFVSLPFYFQTVLHRSPVETGFLMTPWAVVVALAAPLAGRMSDRHAPGLLGGVGLAVLCAGMLSLALLTPESSATDIVLRMAICGAGFGFFQSPNLKALMSAAPAHRSGGASGIIALARLLGQTSGAALVALCFGLGGQQGPLWALALGAGFAALASASSFARLRFG
jgi:MFS transporter, DHA2 family, multidrug resistance protein